MFERNRIFSTRKAMFVQGLESFLFTPFYDSLRDRVQEIVSRNAMLGGSPIGIYHKGKYITEYGTRQYKHIPKVPVHPNLLEPVEELLADWDTIKADQQAIANGVAAILPIDPSYQDVRDSLPDYLKCQELGTYEYKRTRPEAFFVIKSKVKLADWHKTRDIIEKYMVTRFLQT